MTLGCRELISIDFPMREGPTDENLTASDGASGLVHSRLNEYIVLLVVSSIPLSLMLERLLKSIETALYFAPLL